jgi:hypothetical protein
MLVVWPATLIDLLLSGDGHRRFLLELFGVRANIEPQLSGGRTTQYTTPIV